MASPSGTRTTASRRDGSLAGDAFADVVVVGGGHTGLWAAYYLKKVAPFL